MKILKISSAISIFIFAASQALANEKESTLAGYVLTQVQITNPERFFGGYVPKAAASVASFNGEFIVATNKSEILEGSWPANLTVVLKFPSKKQAKLWYQSEHYQNNVLPIRLESAEYTNMVLTEHHVPQHQP